MNKLIRSSIVAKVVLSATLSACAAIPGYAQADRPITKTGKTILKSLQAETTNCNVYNVAGSYGYSATGFVVVANPFGTPPVPIAEVATFVLNADGTLAITKLFTNINGFVSAGSPVTGTFKVNPDCTFNATNQFGDGFFGVFVDDRREIRYIRTSAAPPPEPGRVRGVVTYVAKRM